MSAPKLKFTQSMPALNAADTAQRKLELLKSKQSAKLNNDTGIHTHLTPSLQRSKSLADIDEITLTWRNLVESIPFMAIPGVSSELGLFRRTVSTKHVTRISSEQRSSYNIQRKISDSLTQDSSTEEGSPLFGRALELFEAPPFTTALGLAMSTAILSSFQVGYNSSVMNVPEQVIRSSLECSEFIWSIAVAIFALGALVGSLISGKMADKFGRKNFLIMNNVLFIIGALIEALAYNSSMLVIARVLLGIGSGGATVVVPLYLGEIAPADLRGALGTMNQFAQVLGILVVVLLGKPLGTYDTWRYLLGLPVLPAILQLSLSPVLLESPLWLVGRGTSRALAQAEDILSNLRGEEDVSYDINIMKKSRNAEKRAQENNKKQSTFQQLAEYRLAVFIGLFLQVAQQFSGINGVFYYSTSFFQSAGVKDAWLGSVLACAINVIATGLAIYLMDIAGRRLLLIISSIGMAVSAGVLTVALYYVNALSSAANAATQAPVVADQAITAASGTASVDQMFGYLCVFGVLAFVALFELGLGPIPWLIGAEIFPSGVRATAMTSISSMNWLANFTVGLTFPHINKFLQWLTFVPFGSMCILTALFTIKFIPETKGKSFQQIQNELGLTPKDTSQSKYGTLNNNRNDNSNSNTLTTKHINNANDHSYQNDGPLAPLPEMSDDIEYGNNGSISSGESSSDVSPYKHIVHNILEVQHNQSPRQSSINHKHNKHDKRVSFETTVFNNLMNSHINVQQQSSSNQSQMSHRRTKTPDTRHEEDTNENDSNNVSMSASEAAELARRTGLSFQPHILSNSPIITQQRSPSPLHTYMSSSLYNSLPPIPGSTPGSRQSSAASSNATANTNTSSNNSNILPPHLIPIESKSSPLLARDPSLTTSPKQYPQQRLKHVNSSPSPAQSPLLPPYVQPKVVKGKTTNTTHSHSQSQQQH